ncbi:cytochrome C [Alcanivorax sp. 97CO-5]|uniref:Cytochrome c5, putative n=1 Tax=Alcanivorax borkumensis (strain ATCC 700651 / DSM 11573 / NCIMB 13689 / SK2) TaxID=393595 RepID=Q0VLG1_ALCBS|nr:MULTISPECIES: c-type cytochrome [Alcanivorax]EUC70982.1 cytochrome C [Alcanivorax sp. 97CO-5]BAP15439.1 cytochrome c5 [Alcanivorax sp. NBRC 101098]CAL17987.1 Cytochrome c5, putative [Alcanivorax borkumensis SK2]
MQKLYWYSIAMVLPVLWLAGCSDDSAPANGPAQQARDGAQLYRQYCVTCHGSGALGAPGVGKEHRPYWSHEIEEDGFDALVLDAINGFNSMPPRGGCFDCSDDEIRSTVIYMLNKSGAK